MSEARERRLVAAILLLALGLRLIALEARTLWYDEAFAVLFAEKGWEAMREGTLTAAGGAAADVHPLLYYQTLNIWMDAFGQSVAAVRLYSAILGVMTVGAVYLLARAWFGARTALIAALITAVVPFHVQYSQEVRMYALLGLTLTLATGLYWWAWQREGLGHWAAFGVAAGISMYVQQLAAVSLAALGLLPFLLRDRRRAARTVGAAVLAGAIYLPWMVHLPDQLGKLRQYWVQKPSIWHLWLALRSFTSVNLDFAPAWWAPTFLIAAVLTVLLAYRGQALLRSARATPRERLAVTWALWLAFAPILLMWAISYLFQPIFLPRALLPAALILYIALAWLFTQGGMPRIIVAGVAAAWGVVIVFGLITHYTWDTFPNAPFDRAAAYIDGQRRPQDAVVHANKITALPMIYYARAMPQRYVRDIPGSGSDTLALPTQKVLGLWADPCVAVAADGAPRVWYVTFERLEQEMAVLVADDPARARYDSLQWLRAHYAAISQMRFNDLLVYRFEGPDAIARQARCEDD